MRDVEWLFALFDPFCMPRRKGAPTSFHHQNGYFPLDFTSTLFHAIPIPRAYNHNAFPPPPHQASPPPGTNDPHPLTPPPHSNPSARPKHRPAPGTPRRPRTAHPQHVQRLAQDPPHLRRRRRHRHTRDLQLSKVLVERGEQHAVCAADVGAGARDPGR